MPKLALNPVGDLIPSLQRIEGAIVDLRGDLGPVGELGAIHSELQQVNATLVTMVELIEGLRGDLVQLAASR